MSESIWKKEIHLRKRKDAQPEPVVEVAASAPEGTSVWKKELRLRKRPEPLPPLPARLLEGSRVRDDRARGTVVVPVVPGAADPLQRVERWTARVPEPRTQFPLPSAAGEGQDPVALLPRERATESAPHVPDASTVEPEADTLVMPAITMDTPVPTPEPAPPVALPPAPAPAHDAPVDPEPAVPAWPARTTEVEPIAVAEARLEPEPAREEKVPLLKREISFRRKPRAPKEPKAEKQPKPTKEPKAKREAPAEKVPLLKRELRLPRRSKHTAAAKSAGDHKITNVVGLRIGSTQLAAAHVRNNGSAEVMQLARVPLDHGLVVAGEVREPIALAKALKAFFAENKLPRKGIRLGVASNRIGVRVLEVPAVEDPKHFENAIRFRAQELLPIPIAEAVLDHAVIGEEVVGDGETMRRVLLVFAHRELISRYVDVCRQAGLRLTGIDLDAFALLRAIGPQADGENRRASVAVAVGHERSVFAVSDGELCEFTRVLEWGSNAIDVAIARALNLSPSQAEPLKVALDLDASEPPAGLGPMQFEVARSAVKAEIGHLVRELLSSLRFYQSLPDSLDLHEVVLTGGGAELPGLAAEVQRGLGVPVRVGDPFARVSFAKRLTAPDSVGSYAVAVGLGIEA